MSATGRDGDAEVAQVQAPLATTLRASGRQAELSALAAQVGGELANLLTPLLGNVTLLEEELPDGHWLGHRVRAIQEAATAARAFAQRLLVLDPKRKLGLRDTRAGELLEGCLAAVRAELAPATTLAGERLPLPDLVRVDHSQIERAVVELVRNAQEATAGGGNINVDAAVVDGGEGGIPAGRWLRISVCDRGPGIDASVAGRIFEPGVTTKVPGGTSGLGLAIVEAIARRHGGFAEVGLQAGLGVRASLYLPRQEAATQSAATPAPRTERRQGGGVPGATVMLVEDNPMVRRSIEATLRGGGYEVISVDSGARCLERVAEPQMPVSLLISDVVMPEMGGDELMERARALRPDLPVLFISGYDRSSLAGRQPSGNEHFLQKPFDAEDLFAAVRAALAGRPDPPQGI